MRALQQWLRKYGVYLGAAVFVVAYAFPFMKRAEEQLWRKTYRPAAARMQAGAPIHRLEPDAYAYPPAMAMLSIPLANLPPRLGDLAWYGLSVLATGAAAVCAWRLAGGPALAELSSRWGWVLAIGGVLAGRHLLSPLENQSFDGVIAGLLLAGCLLLARGRDLTGAAAIGLAASMKLTPLLFAPYLLWRKRWKAATLVVAVAAAMNLLPDLFFPQRSGTLYLDTWRTTFLTKAVEGAPGTWIPERQFANRTKAGNQSLAGLYNRYVLFGLPTSYQQIDSAPGEPSPAQETLLRVVTYTTAAFLAVLAVLVFGPGRRGRLGNDTAQAPGGGERPVLSTSLECGAVLCLMLLFSPMTSKSHYAVVVLPCFLLARFAVESKRPSFFLLLGVLAITGPLCAKDLVGKTLGDLLLFWGGPTYFALAAYAGMLLIAATWRDSQQQPATEETALAQAA